VENFQGLSSPTNMAFVDGDNLLVLEKASQVRLVSNGILQKQPVLTIPVNNLSERGLLGIAVLKENSTSAFTDKQKVGESAASMASLSATNTITIICIDI
jgi:hypothetical protein